MTNHYQYSFTKTSGFKKISIPPPSKIEEDEILVKNLFVGICGSDLFHHYSCKENELFLGHEWIGEVISVGKNSNNISPGDWITTSATLGCGKCKFCLEGKVNYCENPTHLGSNKIGALRSYLQFKSFNALKLKSKHISETLIEVMAVAEEALSIVCQNSSSNFKNALILGGGSVGILCAYLLNQRGIKATLLEISNERIERAKTLGIHSLPLKKELLMGEKNNYDLILDATNDRENNTGGLNFIQNFMAKNSLILVIGKYSKAVEINPNIFAFYGAKLMFMRGVPLNTLQSTIDKWSGKLQDLYEKIVTHELSSTQLDEAFALAHQAHASGKVIIQME